MASTITTLFALSVAGTVLAQNACPGAFRETDPAIAAKGFTAYVIARNLTNPRGIVFDKDGNLLVLERYRGVTALKLKDGGNCTSVVSKTRVLNDGTLNHGLQLSVDGTQLFASSREGVYSWPYESAEPKITGDYTTWVTGMNQTGHATRTLLLSKKAPGILLVSRGSGPNIDPLARNINTGVSQIRAFDVSGPPKEYKYTDGKVIGWGLRNSVGLGENPADGGIWSNENASDNMFRDDKDIHETSPGEEVNYHGTLTGNTSELHGKNYGYPDCAAAWDIPNLPRNTELKVGDHFTHKDTVESVDDEKCNREYIAPRLTLPSHWAPIDIAFNSKGTVAFMTSHGSWNKEVADGYKLFAITFANGQPTHAPTSKVAAISLLSRKDQRSCGKPGIGKICFRPTGVDFDGKGRLFMASDATGEIYVITRTDGRSVGESTVEELEALQSGA